MAGKEVAVATAEQYPVLIPGGEEAQQMQEVLSENFGDGGVGVFDLDAIKIPSGGGIAWEVPTLDGIDSTQEIEGIIVAWGSPRSFWFKSLDDSGEDGGTPPDCASDDGQLGFGAFGVGSEAHPTGECETCPMNQWESDPKGGKGKACKESRLLFFLMEGRTLPLTVSLAPTSIQPLRKYFLRLAGNGTPYYGVTTKLKLRKEQGEGSIKYSVAEPAMGVRLSPEMRAEAKAFGRRITQAFVQPNRGSSEATRAQAEEQPVAPADAQPADA